MLKRYLENRKDKIGSILCTGVGGGVKERKRPGQTPWVFDLGSLVNIWFPRWSGECRAKTVLPKEGSVRSAVSLGHLGSLEQHLINWNISM